MAWKWSDTWEHPEEEYFQESVIGYYEDGRQYDYHYGTKWAGDMQALINQADLYGWKKSFNEETKVFTFDTLIEKQLVFNFRHSAALDGSGVRNDRVQIKLFIVYLFGDAQGVVLIEQIQQSVGQFRFHGVIIFWVRTRRQKYNKKVTCERTQAATDGRRPSSPSFQEGVAEGRGSCIEIKKVRLKWPLRHRAVFL